MAGILARTDDVLRRRGWAAQPATSWASLRDLGLILVCFGLLYGACMGSFGGVIGQRAWQVAISAVKVPLLLSATFAVSLPSFFVLNSLFGLRHDFAAALRAVLATQAGVAIVLASLSPFTLLWYASFSDYNMAVLFNLGMFAVASFAGQILLWGYYRPLIAKNPRHRLMLWAWVVVYAFVGIQMAWILRPFIGNLSGPPQFFREDTWGNAYLIVLELVGRLLGW